MVMGGRVVGTQQQPGAVAGTQPFLGAMAGMGGGGNCAYRAAVAAVASAPGADGRSYAAAVAAAPPPAAEAVARGGGRIPHPQQPQHAQQAEAGGGNFCGGPGVKAGTRHIFPGHPDVGVRCYSPSCARLGPMSAAKLHLHFLRDDKHLMLGRKAYAPEGWIDKQGVILNPLLADVWEKNITLGEACLAASRAAAAAAVAAASAAAAPPHDAQ